MAYVNATINETGVGTFQSDTAAAVTIALYTRCKFSTNLDTSADGKPTLLVAGVADRGNVTAMQPIAAAAYGTVRFLNAPGEQFGIASGTIGIGVSVYTAAAGKYSTVSTGGAVLAGTSTSAGYDGGPFTFQPINAAA